MESPEKIKEMVREKYSAIATQNKTENAASCCGATGCCDTIDYAVFAEKYDALGGYVSDADLGLGCGIPTEFAKIKTGDTVIDLGSGAGNDCFVARAMVGEHGKVIGIDMTPAMITKARDNAEKLNFNNVEFRLGEIEVMPVGGNRADVIISNCVLNLVPNKAAAFKEMFRVLKPQGHFSISDVVLSGELPEGIRQAAEMYAGCVSGALQKEEYLKHITDAGFENVQVMKEKAIVIPDEILAGYLDAAGIEKFRNSGTSIYSITVYGEKPKAEACCDPSTGCCN